MWSSNGKVWTPEMKNVESKISHKVAKPQRNYADWWINHLIRPSLYFPQRFTVAIGH